MPKLSDARIRSAKPKSAPYKVFDIEGLFLSVQPSGAKWWRQRYRFAGKERLLSLGVYPLIGFGENKLCVDMPLSEFESKRVEKAVYAFLEKRRPPPHVRPQLDIGYRIAGQSLELFEIRPQWDSPKERREHPFAKATYVKTTGTWKVFWRRADLKWHGYEPAPQVGSVEKFLEVVDEDKHACFFG